MSNTQSPGPLVPRLATILVWTERIIFFLIGVLLFAAALALLWHSLAILIHLFAASNAPGGESDNSIIVVGSQFLDVTLLVLMVVELAYTVMLSLRGAVLRAEPFLIVGLIAVIRRILVITVGEVNSPMTSGKTPNQTAMELLILTAVVLAFVASIYVLRRRDAQIPIDDDPH